MAKMYGRIKSIATWGHCQCSNRICPTAMDRTKRSIRQQEERRWRSEVDLEMDRNYHYERREAEYQRSVRLGHFHRDY